MFIWPFISLIDNRERVVDRYLLFVECCPRPWQRVSRCGVCRVHGKWVGVLCNVMYAQCVSCICMWPGARLTPHLWPVIRDHISIKQPHSIYPDKLKVAAAKDETTGDSAGDVSVCQFLVALNSRRIKASLKNVCWLSQDRRCGPDCVECDAKCHRDVWRPGVLGLISVQG